MNYKKLLSFSKAIVCLFVIFGGSNLFAQYYDSPGLGQKPIATHPQDYKPLGVRAGAFMLHPGVQLAAQFTDNAFYSYDNEQSDTVFHIRPYITAQSTWSRHSLNLSLAADIAMYDDFGERDYEDYFLSVAGRIDVKNRSFFTYGLDYMDLHEGLNNRTSEQGVEPTRYSVFGGRLGYDHTFNRLSVGVGYSYNELDYDDVLGSDEDLIDNQDRNRVTHTYSVRADYQFSSNKAVFVSYQAYETKYKQNIDRNGYSRSGDGYTINGGISFSIAGRLEGDVFASYYNRDFDDPNLTGDDGFLIAGGAGLQWNPTSLTSVYGRITTGVQDTTDANSTSYVNSVFSLRVDHELTTDIQLNAFAAYSINDYNPIDPTAPDLRSKDNIFRAGLGLNWYINRHVYLNASYDYETLDSSVPLDDYNVNNFWLNLGLEY
jgi:hypothetical protein